MMNKSMIRPVRYFICILLIGLLNILVPAEWKGARAAMNTAELGSNTDRIELVVKKSYLISLQTPTNRVSIVDPAIADVQIIDPKQIMLSAMSVGETSLMVWTDKGKTRMYDVVVTLNIAKIQEMLRMILPDETIEVLPMEQGVVLRGNVRKVVSVEKAMEIAQAFTPKVMNYLTMPGTHQVLLKVKVAEVNRTFQEQLGFNAFFYDKDFQLGNKLGNLMTGEFTANNPNITFSDAVTLFFGFPKGKLQGFIQALKSKGLVHILAEPNLIARSGETATFLAGGEYPIPIVQGGANGNTVSVEYKEFGVRLNFTPVVLSEDTIQLDISPEVSDLDFSRGVQFGGYSIPGLITRRAHTNVKLQDGQTFAIAGLVNQTRQRTHRKVPLVGDIPVLGGLFKNSDLQGKDTELLIMVTPSLVFPLDATQMLPLPDVNTKPGKMNSLLDMQKGSKDRSPEKVEEKKVAKVDIQYESLPLETNIKKDVSIPAEKKLMAEKVNEDETKQSSGSKPISEQPKKATWVRDASKPTDLKAAKSRIPNGSPAMEQKAKKVLPATSELPLIDKKVSQAEVPREFLFPGNEFIQSFFINSVQRNESKVSKTGFVSVTPAFQFGADETRLKGLVSSGEARRITRAEIQRENLPSDSDLSVVVRNTPPTTNAHLSRDNPKLKRK